MSFFCPSKQQSSTAAARPQLPTCQQGGFGYQQRCPPNTTSVLPRHSQQCCNTYLPWDIRRTCPVRGCAFPRLPHGSAPKLASTASSISRSHGRGGVVLVKQPWACSRYTPQPYSLCILLRCSANLGSLPAVKPNTADRSASRGKRSVFYPLWYGHCSVPCTITSGYCSCQHGCHTASFHLSQLRPQTSYFC